MKKKPETLDPVDTIPPIERETTHRRSKYDEVLDEAFMLRGEEQNAVPVVFRNPASAASGRRRIMDRVPLHDHDNFQIEQRNSLVFVKALR